MTHIVKNILLKNCDFTKKGSIFYEIEWAEEGSANTFEPFENLTDCNDKLQAYLHLKIKNKVSF